eukprot:TRINITY_DN5862_c0_g3_i1.p1 TRINITY_DN5862_c0_g3~~TRINITY_DN5862_c0_g3_i1.p1  ORF type:complete len:145 (-),score=16.63 TRINITY_DN5862_c0_g3_i1:132-566(-)
MRLSTHNLLECTTRCIARGYPGYPLKIRAASAKYEEHPCVQGFTVDMIRKIDYGALSTALVEMRQCLEDAGVAALMGGIPELPPALPADHDTNDEFLRKLHVVLFELHLIEGMLVCPACGAEFPVKDGIPQMLVNEVEVGGAAA